MVLFCKLASSNHLGYYGYIVVAIVVAERYLARTNKELYHA